MGCNNLNPSSNTSTSVLPSTGSSALVAACLPLGVYGDSNSDLYSTDFISGAVDQVAYTYKMLGGDILDLEITACNVYACYENAAIEYSTLVNMHQAQNVLSNVLGHATGTFDQDGNLKDGILKTSLSGTHIALKYPKFDFEYARRVGDGMSFAAGIGGTENEYSASFSLTASVQDYDLQTIISQSAASNTALDYYNKVGNKKIIIKKVFYKTPSAMWRFYSFSGTGGGLNVVGNMASYGQYSDASTFEVVPVWQNKLQAMAYEDAIYTRNSHYSYEIKNNRIRIFPPPPTYPGNNYPNKMWIQFSIPSDAWNEETDSETGVDGINNMNTIPFSNIPFGNINSIGKHWIRRFALACSKSVLAQVRGKFGAIPIPNNSVTLNAAELAAQAAEEMSMLRDELKDTLSKLTYKELSNQDAEIIESTQRVQEKIPMGIFIG